MTVDKAIDALTTAPGPKPNFFIVGAPKCGTTSLHEYLQRHPQIYMPFYKEPHFFGSDLVGTRFEQFRAKPQKYLRLFREAKAETRLGESSPWYLVSRTAAQEIKSYNADSKIIILLRHPVDMMYSMWSQFRYSGNEQIRDFESAIAAEPMRKSGQAIRRAAHCITGLFYKDMARYSTQVERYFDAFGKKNVMVVLFDDFQSDTERVYRDTLEFLDVDPSYTTSFDVANPNKEVRLEWLQEVILSTGFSLMLLKDRLTYLASTSPFSPKGYKQTAVKGVISAYTRYEKRSPLTAELRRRLTLEFSDEIDQLEKLLNRDLSHWREDRVAD